MLECTFWISTNTPSSKNSKVWTGTHFVVSKAVTKWKNETKLEWEYQKERFLDQLEDLSLPYYIEFTFYRKSKHEFDYINIAQTVQDEMVEQKWLKDDNTNIMKPYFGDYVYDNKNPGVLIKILKEKPKHYG